MTEHGRTLTKAYAKELHEVVAQAEAWWHEASPEARELWPFGVASHPRVIATVRKYFFLLEQQARLDDGELDPTEFVRDALEDEPVLSELLETMVLTPIGVRAGEHV